MTPGSVQLHDRPNQCLSVGVSNATNEVKVVLLSMKSGYNLRSPVFPCCAEVIAAASPVALLQGGRTRFTRHKGGGTPVVQRPLTFRTTAITSRLVGFPVCPFRGVDACGATGDQRGHQLMDWEQFGDLICGGRLVRAGRKQRGWGGVLFSRHLCGGSQHSSSSRPSGPSDPSDGSPTVQMGQIDSSPAGAALF